MARTRRDRDDDSATVTDDVSRRVTVTHPEKELWPDARLTKADLVAYYQAVAPVLLPHLVGRPLVMKPYPNGIEGRSYFRQSLPKSAPPWLPRYEHRPAEGTTANQMPLVDDVASLTWLVNQAAIEMHPWLSRVDAPKQPDYVVFDLDVTQAERFPLALRAALLVRREVEQAGLVACAKTTGGDGVHLYVPLARGAPFTETRAWALSVAERLTHAHPELFTIDSKLAGRQSLVLIDYAQNALGKTTVAPYSVRPRPGATVSTPLTWQEIERGDVRPADFTLRTVPGRIARHGDLFAQALRGTATVPAMP